MITLKKWIFLLTLCLITSCDQDNSFNQLNTLVPRVNVNTTINDIAFISSPGSFTTIRQGYLGIIIFNIDGNTFRAFDLGCPYISPNECNTPMRVNTADGEMSCVNCANDEVSFTQFRTAVTVGDKTYHLREYNAFLENGIVRITNF